MAIVINGITCQEIVRDFQEGSDWKTGPRARKGFLCDWDDRFAVARGLLGLTASDGGGGMVVIQPPSPYPDVAVGMYVLSIEVEPVGAPAQGTPQIRWPKAIIWANYGVYPYTVQSGGDEDPSNPYLFCEMSLAWSTQYVTTPGMGLKFQTGAPLEQNYGIPVAVAEILLTFHRMPLLPSPATLGATVGKINDATFLGASNGKMMFNGCSTRRTAMSDGSYAQAVTYAFSYRPVARWDAAFSPTDGDWVAVRTLGGSPVIAAVNFNQIIPLGLLK